MISLARSSVLARSRHRRRSAGATMFIVVVTLALLAVMGVYGLTAASNDIKSGGHVRSRAQAMHASEYASAFASEGFTRSTTSTLLTKMCCKTMALPVNAQPCVSANKRSAISPPPIEEWCLAVNLTGNPTINYPLDVQAWYQLPTWQNKPLFADEAIGSKVNGVQMPGVRDPMLDPYVKLELTNPQPGGKDKDVDITVVTATSYVYVATPDAVKTDQPTRPYDEVFKSRGFLRVPGALNPNCNFACN